MPSTRPLPGALVALLAMAVVGCGGTDGPPGREAVDVAPPDVGDCRVLRPADIERPSNATDPVACAREHTAETFAVHRFPASLRDTAYDGEALGRYVYGVCDPGLAAYLGTDESRVLRSLLSWAWFRPSRAAWDAGARWYRCDVVGGRPEATSYRPLPRTARGFLGGRPREAWTLCATGARIAGSPKVACAQPHDWRAVTTIQLGAAGDAYPGDRVAQLRSQEYCSDSVGAWLGYPKTNYDYGSTVFGEAEWKAGNRRSICWARTSR